MGGSSDLCAVLKPGEPVVLMGPTGTPTEIHADTTVALVGGGLGNAVLFSIGAALRAAGSKVIYFAGYKQMRDRYKVGRDRARRRRHRLVLRRGARLHAHAARRTAASSATSCRRWRPTAPGGWASRRCRWRDADHMIVIGSDRMMQAVGAARHGVLAPYAEARPHRDRVDQLADAVHDEGGLRAVPAAA